MLLRLMIICITSEKKGEHRTENKDWKSVTNHDAFLAFHFPFATQLRLSRVALAVERIPRIGIFLSEMV